MANIEEAIRRLQFLYETHGAEEVARAQAAITASTATTEKASLSLEKSFNNLERRYISTVRAQNEYERAVRVANDAVQQNPALQERANAVINAAQTQYIRAAQGAGTYGQAVQQTADSSRLARHELINLSRQIQDVGVSLASGQAPMTVLIQQGAQIADVFATSSGTVMGFARQAGSWALGFARSMAGVATAVAAVGVAWIAAGVSFTSGQNEIERALTGMGAASGLTSKKINEIAMASSSAFGLSTAQAREAATAFAATGRIYEDNVKTATSAVSDFAKATGTDAAAATKTLAAALVDPAAGAVELNKQFNFLDATTLEYIRTLQAQGKMQEAQAAVMELLIPKIQKMAEKVSGLGPAYDLAANAAKGFWDIAGRNLPTGPSAAVRPPSMSEQDTAKEERFKQMSTDANAAERSILGVIGQIQTLQGELSKLRSLREATDGAMTGAEQVGNVRLQQLQDQEQALIRQAQYIKDIAAFYPGMSADVAKQLDMMNAQLAVAQARTESERIIEQEYVDQLAGQQQNLSLEERLAQAALKRQINEENVRRSIDDQIKSLYDQIELSKARMSGTEAQVKAEQAYKKVLADTGDEKKAGEMRDATMANERQRQTEQAAHSQDTFTDSVRQSTQATSEATDGMQHFGWQVGNVTNSVYQLIDAFQAELSWFHHQSMAYQIDNRLRHTLNPVFDFNEEHTVESDPAHVLTIKKSLEDLYGAQNVEPYTVGNITAYRLKPEFVNQQMDAGTLVGSQDISSPAAIQASFQNIAALGFKDGIGSLTRLVDAVSDPSTQASLIQQAINQINATEQPSVAREEMIQALNDKLEQLTNSTDSLNSTMQNALSPFYSQDPRTTKLGFRAGVTGNPDWMTGATNANPLVAVLGPGATAPGMAGGGSFVVGGGYSANDNRMAVFPVASGEEIVVNRNKEGTGGQVVNIDNRIFVAGAVDENAMSKMKVSRYQQAQRMRAGMARA